MAQPIARYRTFVAGALKLPLPPAARDDAIAAFLAGQDDGEPVFHALFDDILDEPVPARLIRMLCRAGD